ncbi:unnamed protein product, partial [Rotaria sp. Silwood1]
MERIRSFPGCSIQQYVNDTSIRDRFAKGVQDA